MRNIAVAGSGRIATRSIFFYLVNFGSTTMELASCTGEVEECEDW